jgi:hypothetical protein
MCAEATDLSTKTPRALLRRLATLGFPAAFLRRAVLPDWWDAACDADESLLGDLKIRTARFLGVGASALESLSDAHTLSGIGHARLRKVRNIDADRVAPAIYAGMQVAGAVLRALRDPSRAAILPPRDAAQWCAHIKETSGRVDLQSIAADLWRRGIPVIPIDGLPAPKFQGMACVVSGRPAIVLGHAHDALPRLAFLVAHEAGHIAYGDCEPDAPVVDEDDEVADDDPIEARADSFAWRSLAAGSHFPDLGREDTWKGAAKRAAAWETERGIDAGATVWSWACRSRRFQDGQLALAALYVAQGGQRILRELYDEHVDAESASETDFGLLNCVAGGLGRDAPAA